MRAAAAAVSSSPSSSSIAGGAAAATDGAAAVDRRAPPRQPRDVAAKRAFETEAEDEDPDDAEASAVITLGIATRDFATVITTDVALSLHHHEARAHYRSFVSRRGGVALSLVAFHDVGEEAICGQ